MPPTKTFPATPAAPADAVLWVTLAVAVLQPCLEAVTPIFERRGSLNVHGVEVQLIPLLSSICALCGTVLTTNTSFVPLVMVAQPDNDRAAIAEHAIKYFIYDFFFHLNE
jgi:hypothetical protein